MIFGLHKKAIYRFIYFEKNRSNIFSNCIDKMLSNIGQFIRFLFYFENEKSKIKMDFSFKKREST